MYISLQSFEEKNLVVLLSLSCLFFFLLGQTWSLFPLQNRQYKQENTRGL